MIKEFPPLTPLLLDMFLCNALLCLCTFVCTNTLQCNAISLSDSIISGSGFHRSVIHQDGEEVKDQWRLIVTTST